LGQDTIRLTVPAVASYTQVATVAATGLATRAGFALDEIDGLSLSVRESFEKLVADSEPDTSLTLTFTIGSDALSVELVAAGERRCTVQLTRGPG
jgi:hypothetical protein